jgi:hypothetical protein
MVVLLKHTFAGVCRRSAIRRDATARANTAPLSFSHGFAEKSTASNTGGNIILRLF